MRRTSTHSHARRAEFTSTSATSVNLDAAWHEIPKTLPNGTAWTMSFTPSETSARYLKVKSAAGATTLAVQDKDGNELDSASIAEGGEIQLFLPRDATKYGQTGGQLQFRLANTGSAALTLDSLALDEGVLRPVRVIHNDDVTVSTATVVEQDTELEIYVAEGKTAVYSGVISGVGAIRKTGPGTLQVTKANTISGGFTVDEGYLKGTPGDGTPVFGSGVVSVEATGTAPCQLIVAGKFPNTFRFSGTSSDTYPAIHFAGTTTLNGTETVDGTTASILADNATVYMTTAWDDTTAHADTQDVTIKNATFARDGTIALAPHCAVSFGGKIYCDLLDLYWRANSSAADGGNPGVVLLPGWGDKLASGACGMKRVRIDQTRIKLAGSNPFGGGNSTSYTFAIVEWTGEHKTGGSIDMNSLKCCLGQVITPPTTPDDETSMRIIQSAATSWLNFYNTPTCTLYLRLEGNMPCSCNTPNSTITFMDRRHLFTNKIIASASKVVITGGTKFLLPCEMNINGSNVNVTFTGLTDPDALKHVTLYTSSKNSMFKFDDASFATVANDYTVSLLQDIAFTYDLPTDSVWHLKSVTANGTAVNAGEYHQGDISGLTLKNASTLLVATTGGEVAERDPVHWDGTNWVDANGQEPTAPLYLAHRAATCETDGASATLPCDAFFSSLLLNKAGEGVFTLSGAEGVSLNISGALNMDGDADYTIQPHTIVGGPIIIDGGRTLTFENDVIFNNTVLVSNKTLAVSGEVSGTGKIILATDTVSKPELKLDGAEIRVPINVGNKSAQGNFYLTATGSTLTNYFHGKLTDTGSTYVYLTEGYTYVFDGGFAMAGKHAFRVNGNDDQGATIILTGTGNTIDWRTNDGWFECGNANHLIFDFVNAGGRYIETPSAKGVIEFKKDDFFPLSYAQTPDRAAMIVNGTFQLNATHQYANCLDGSGSISGAEGAELVIALGTNCTFRGSFTGAVGLTMNGATQAISGVSTSTGAITVKTGILNLIDDAKWENSRAVNVEGGTLALDVKKPFGADTPFNVQPGGTVQLMKRVSVSQASYNGEKLADGVYGAEGSGAEHEVGWITGSGRLRVGTLGLVILVR